MVLRKTLAPAQVNLTYHVTSHRDDGRHEVDSLVVFADTGDQLTATSANEMTFRVSGPFAADVPTGDSNVVMRAAQLLRRKRGVIKGAEITLEKHLPNDAGLGRGASAAAATLKVLADLWQVEPLPDYGPELMALNPNIPVCLHSPSPTQMMGIGDMLMSAPQLPDCAVVLVNPKVDIPVPQALPALRAKDHAPMDDLPSALTFESFAAWLADQRNDLLEPAGMAAPDVRTAIDILQRIPAVAYAGVSGCGATCFGLVRNMSDARHAARVVQVAQMGWWVTPANIMH